MGNYPRKEYFYTPLKNKVPLFLISVKKKTTRVFLFKIEKDP
jgi:hypothetical protein